MRFFSHRFVICAVAWTASSAVAQEASPDPSGMLKVPPPEERPEGDGADPKATAAPAPESTPEVSDGSPANAEQAVAENDDVVQPAFPLSRYEELWKRSPFQKVSAPEPELTAGLAQRFALTGLAAINGEPIAFLMDRATQNRVMVKKDASESGLTLVQVDVQQKYTDSSATVRQGSEVGVVRFDDTAAAPSMMPPQASFPQPQRIIPPGIPQAMGQMPGVPPRVQIPGQPVQAQAVPAAPQVPGVVPAVPGPSVPANGQVQDGSGQMPPPRVIRRRALIPAAP